MNNYRVYFIERNGHIAQPARHFECSGDDEAIQQAQKFIDGLDVELWDGARFIQRFSCHKSEGGSQ
jgi:hypothetical protein